MNNDKTISQEEFEEIERFLSDEMSGEERERFENRLQTDQILREKLRETSLLLMGIKEAALQNKLDSFHQEMGTRSQPAEPVVRKMPARYWLAAAAVIGAIVLAGVFFLRGEDGNEKLYSNYFEADPGLATVMGSVDEYEFNRGMVEYRSGDYKTALSTWRTLRAAGADSDTLNYFSGVAFLAVNETDSAVHFLQKSYTNAQSSFRPDAAWYLGLCMLKKDDNVKARSYIQQSTHPRKDELLSRLK